MNIMSSKKLLRFVILKLYFSQTFYSIDQTCSKALKSLGFYVRNTKKFKNELCLKTLYTTLVKPILEFSSVLWNRLQIGLIESLERVQRRFSHLIAYKRRRNFDLASFIHTSQSSIQASLNLEFLVFRRKHNDI